jgi:hypothetical protein
MSFLQPTVEKWIAVLLLAAQAPGAMPMPPTEAKYIPPGALPVAILLGLSVLALYVLLSVLIDRLWKE